MFKFEGDKVVFYRNVSLVGFKPLYEVAFIAYSFADVDATTWIKILSEDEIDSIFWFFADLENA